MATALELPSDSPSAAVGIDRTVPVAFGYAMNWTYTGVWLPWGVAPGVKRARIFAGHAGWGPGQLEAELEEDSWILEPAERGDVFTADPEALWSQVLRRKGAEYVLLATMPMDPSLN